MPIDQIDFGCIGVGGKGSSDTADAARHGNIAAICDVDITNLEKAAKLYPKAEKFLDYREMLAKFGKNIDAVTVSTPDHHHAPATALAMGMGKHAYTQKPLTRTIWEARRLAEIATEKKVVTQMGNQGTAGASLRQNAALIREGLLGTVKEVHVWTNRPIWPQGQPRPAEKPIPIPLMWDLWLGPAPSRPYGDGYHPFAWRGWWDYGTGALGDMACHTVNLPFMALDLRNPTSVTAQSAPNNKDSFPEWTVIRYEFPATKARPAVTMTWYDGKKLPPLELLDGQVPSNSGSLILGDKGKLYTPGDYGGGGQWVGVSIEGRHPVFPTSPGHFTEFAEAIKNGKQPMSNFPNYAGPLTETILLGNLAVWAGTKVEWDARNMRAKNVKGLDALIRPTYRGDYSV
jgi:predicted dehydrogenase